MKESLIIFIILMIGFIEGFSVIENSLGVKEGEEFSVQISDYCEEECTKSYEIGVWKMEEVVYHKENGSETEDCFGDTCINMDYHGPVYASKGFANWSCGPCFKRYPGTGEDIRGIQQQGCVEGMKNIIGIPVCLETQNGEKWDIVFEIWSSTGTNEFKYKRAKEFNLMKTSETENSFWIKELTKEVTFTGEKNITFVLNSSKPIGKYEIELRGGENSELIEIEIVKEDTEVIPPENNSVPEEKKTPVTRSSGGGGGGSTGKVVDSVKETPVQTEEKIVTSNAISEEDYLDSSNAKRQEEKIKKESFFSRILDWFFSFFS